jgi:hypothetical protein
MIKKKEGDWKQQNIEFLLKTNTHISHKRYLFFSDMALCLWVNGAQLFETVFMSQNIKQQSPSNAASYPRRMKTSTTLLQKPKISHLSPSIHLLTLQSLSNIT